MDNFQYRTVEAKGGMIACQEERLKPGQAHGTHSTRMQQFQEEMNRLSGQSYQLPKKLPKRKDLQVKVYYSLLLPKPALTGPVILGQQCGDIAQCFAASLCTEAVVCKGSQV